MTTHRIRIELWTEAPGGGPSSLTADLKELGTVRSRFLLWRLRRLSDEDLMHMCQKVPGWQKGPEGAWVYLDFPGPLDELSVVGQLDLVTVPGPGYSIVEGVFKIVRVRPTEFFHARLADHAASAGEI